MLSVLPHLLARRRRQAGVPLRPLRLPHLPLSVLPRLRLLLLRLDRSLLLNSQHLRLDRSLHLPLSVLPRLRLPLTAVSVSLLMLAMLVVGQLARLRSPQAVLLRLVRAKPQAVPLLQVVYLSVAKHSVMFHGLMILQLGIRQQILLRLANTEWVKWLTGIVAD